MMKTGRVLFAVLGLGLATLFNTGAANSEPPKIKIGDDVAAEEQLWLRIAKLDIGAHYGKDYVLRLSLFRRFHNKEA